MEDVADLEKILKRAIILKDIAGEEIYNSGKYQSSGWKTVELIVHNGHAWTNDLRFPASREVQIYEGDVWQAIQQATEGEPIAVWLLGGQDKQLHVDQFVLQDGRTYRTQEKQDDLYKTCQSLTEKPEQLAQRAFGVNHAASIVAREKNGWKPTPASFIDDVQKACVEHGHGGLWNADAYHVDDIVSIDMKACYPASFQGKGECAPYFDRFGHPTSEMTRVSINGPLPQSIGTGFAQVRSWAFDERCHPVIPAWFGKHFEEHGWAPTQLLAFMMETGILTHLEVAEAIVSFRTQQEVWLPESRGQGCSIIGKFTQGSKAEGMRLTRRLVMDQGELDYLVQDTVQNGTLVGAPQRCPLGHILTYYDGSQPQYTHLRASMLAYAHINLLSMLTRFSQDEAVRVATDSLYVMKTALHRLHAINAFVGKQRCQRGEDFCISCLLEEEFQPPVKPAQWRDKNETLYMPQDHASYQPKPEYWENTKDIPDSQAPPMNDPLALNRLSYLNGGGGSGKTTRAINVFRNRNPLVLTPTHRLAKEMRNRDVKAQTYHSFFRWSGQREWTPERMGQKYIPRVTIWDEVCTVPRPILQTFLDWLDMRGVQVVCCGDQGQPPPIAGQPPHEWLTQHVDFYEEVAVDHRAKDEALKTLKRAMRLQSDKVQCEEMRKGLPICLGWERFLEQWTPDDLMVVSRTAVRDQAQKLLLARHKEFFPNAHVPLLYHPKDTRKQNIHVTIPGTDEKDALVLNDIVKVSIEAAERAIQTEDWRLGYAMTVHLSQGLTIENPQKVWIIDDYLQWSNLAYLAVSRVEYLSQLERIAVPPNEGTVARQPSERDMRKAIPRKLVACKRQDEAKQMGFNLKVADVLTLKQQQNNYCAACNIDMLWLYAPKDTQQFSVDRLDNSQGHIRGNVRLTCLECNRRRGAAVLQ